LKNPKVVLKNSSIKKNNLIKKKLNQKEKKQLAEKIIIKIQKNPLKLNEIFLYNIKLKL